MDSARTTVDDDPGEPEGDRLLFRRLGESTLTPPEGGNIVIRDERPDVPRGAPDPELRRVTAETAHDFNNLLSVILSCASELESGTDSETSRERGGEIRQAAERGARLARKLINTAKPKDGAPAPIDLNDALEASCHTLRRALGPGIRCGFAPAAWIPNVLLHPEELEQILLNLANNAHHALDGAGEFTLSTEPAAIGDNDSMLRPGWHVRLTARDDGPGMPPEVQARALEPFYTTKREAQGNGLGLPTIADIARSRGGDVRIDSAPGEGTTIALYLPAVRSNGDPLALR